MSYDSVTGKLYRFLCQVLLASISAVPASALHAEGTVAQAVASSPRHESLSSLTEGQSYVRANGKIMFARANKDVGKFSYGGIWRLSFSTHVMDVELADVPDCPGTVATSFKEGTETRMTMSEMGEYSLSIHLSTGSNEDYLITFDSLGSSPDGLATNVNTLAAYPATLNYVANAASFSMAPVQASLNGMPNQTQGQWFFRLPSLKNATGTWVSHLGSDESFVCYGVKDDSGALLGTGYAWISLKAKESKASFVTFYSNLVKGASNVIGYSENTAKKVVLQDDPFLLSLSDEEWASADFYSAPSP